MISNMVMVNEKGCWQWYRQTRWQAQSEEVVDLGNGMYSYRTHAHCSECRKEAESGTSYQRSSDDEPYVICDKCKREYTAFIGMEW